MHDLKQLARMSQDFRTRIVEVVNKNPETLKRIGLAAKEEANVGTKRWVDLDELVAPQTAEDFASRIRPW